MSEEFLGNLIGTAIVVAVTLGAVCWFDGELSGFKITVLVYLISLQSGSKK